MICPCSVDDIKNLFGLFHHTSRGYEKSYHSVDHVVERTDVVLLDGLSCIHRSLSSFFSVTGLTNMLNFLFRIQGEYGWNLLRELWECSTSSFAMSAQMSSTYLLKNISIRPAEVNFVVVAHEDFGDERE